MISTCLPDIQVHGTDFIIQRFEAQTSIFPKLRQRRLHQRPQSLQRVTPDGVSEADSTAGGAMIVASQQERLPPVIFEGRTVIDITQLLEPLEPPPSEAPKESPAAGAMACSAAVHVPGVPPPDLQVIRSTIEAPGTREPRLRRKHSQRSSKVSTACFQFAHLLPPRSSVIQGDRSGPKVFVGSSCSARRTKMVGGAMSLCVCFR